MKTARAASAAAFAAAALAAPRPAAAQTELQAPDVPGYSLRPTPDGGYVHDEDAWKATIAPDGTVRFTDHWITVTDVRFGPLDLLARLGGPTLRRPSLESALRGLMERQPPPDPWAETRAPIWKYHADPRDACQRRDPCYFVPVGPRGVAIGLGGLMDLTDAYMRMMKQDPYRYAKARFLAATFELRTKMSIDRTAALLRESLDTMQGRLQAIWNDVARAAVERRQILWRLWEEAGDGDSGLEARAIIERFVRDRLPRGSADGFTDTELDRFGSASNGAFAPYGAAAPPAFVPASAPGTALAPGPAPPLPPLPPPAP
jgi:hypothetical protein